MTAREFPTAVRREALKRSNGYCEGRGELYGLEPDARCWWPLENGVEFDHLLAVSNGGDNSLPNCQCLCNRCHSIKTKVDTTRAAKIKRQSDDHLRITKPPKKKIQSRNTFAPYKSNTKHLDRGE